MQRANLMSVGIVAGTCFLLCIGSAGLIALQQGLPDFRSSTHISTVIVRVLDKARRPVSGLKAEDFTVTADGVVRRIEAVVAQDAEGPVSGTPWLREIAPDVATNVLENPRLLVIILDDVGFGGRSGDPWMLRETRAIATGIVDRLGSNDLAAVVFTGDNRSPQDFTGDRARLRAAIERFHDIAIPPGLSDLYRLNTLAQAIEFLKTVPDKRSAIFMITPPLARGAVIPRRAPLPGDLDVSIGESDAQLTLHQRLSLLIEAASLARIPVYPINNNGMPAYMRGPSGAILPPNYSASDFLFEIARATGGRAIVNTNAPRDAVPELFRELSLHYVVGYETPATQDDGRFHRLKIAVNRRDVIVEPPELGYFSQAPTPTERASVERPAPSTTRALAGLIPVSDEPLRLATHSLGPAEGKPDLTVAVFALGVRSPQEVDDIDVELRIFDAEGRRELSIEKQTVHVVPSRARPDAIWDVLTSAELKPGRYNIRAASHGRATGRTGSVYTDIAIPDYRRQPLTLSDLILSSPQHRSYPDRFLAGWLPTAPTTARAFASRESAEVYLYVFAPRGPALSVPIRVEIKNEDGVVVADKNDTVVLREDGVLRMGPFGYSLPISQLKPGQYLLTVVAGSGPVRRNLRFNVSGAGSH